MKIPASQFREMNKKESNNHQALGRLKQGVMNGLEKRYSQILDARKISGEILDWWFEPMNLRLADKCFYKVDFMVLTAKCELEVHETKGRWEDDALVKIKCAAEKFPFRFIALQWIKKEWQIREF